MRSTLTALTTGLGFLLYAAMVLPTTVQAQEVPSSSSTLEMAQVSAPSIVDIATSDEVFSTLVTALQAGDLVDTLSGDGPFTVFAPINPAFAALSEGTLETLLMPENKALLQEILTYHVISGNITSSDLTEGKVSTIAGSDLMVSLEDGVKINNANVLAADIKAGNGVIHVIDAVLLPPSESTEATEMEDSMTEVAVTSPVSMPVSLNIVELAAGNTTFATLVAAVTAGDLVDTLSGEGPFTVFAPTNEAFAALPEGTVETLLMPENKALLQEILTYHVVSGKVTSGDLTAGAVPTVQGDSVMVSLDDGVKINGANVIAADVMVSNGVIHVIDTVIMPEE
ncbi:fasciclin domain-containing protein [[Limnothrix rosea] IAM M-220]|uniref:fasciclin domain-containing protein n=1 Tax=[Limnothrix rosea] IAM M-220 TaxID=454133 RepID=UPI0009FCB659|nr:fasciclin domain-containing protein [[Limnothrix rosea] IAM M-220]